MEQQKTRRGGFWAGIADLDLATRVVGLGMVSKPKSSKGL
jgi:hypothetical protein